MYDEKYIFGAEAQKEEQRTYPAPVRRALARFVDLALFSLAVTAVYTFILGRGPIFSRGKAAVIFIVLCAIASAFLEALMLSMTGTTVGKWLFGIRLTGGLRRNLSFGDALTRNLKRLIIADGLMLPIVSWITMFKAYKACSAGSIMDYDDYTVYEIKERPVVLSGIGTLACVMVAFVLTIALTVCGMAVPNRGDINTEQFIENYNYLVDYTYSSDINRKLDDTMRFVIEDGGQPYKNTSVNFERIGEGNILDGIGLKIKGFNYNYRNTYDYGNEMMFIIMSLADSSFSERFSAFTGDNRGLGLDNDVSVEFADIKAEYSIEMENFRLDIRQNANSKHSGGTFANAGMVKNPDGTYTKDESKAFSVSFGRGRHMFMPIDEEIKSSLEISFTAVKMK